MNRSRNFQKEFISHLRLTYGLVIILCLATVSCLVERDTEITLIEGSNPPTFKIYGNGSTAEFLFYGPYSNCNQESQEEKPLHLRTPLWSISPIERGSMSGVSDYSPFTYGKIPIGYKQVYPLTQDLPVLIEGKSYLLWIRVNSAGNNVINFQIKNNQAIRC